MLSFVQYLTEHSRRTERYQTGLSLWFSETQGPVRPPGSPAWSFGLDDTLPRGSLSFAVGRRRNLPMTRRESRRRSRKTGLRPVVGIAWYDSTQWTKLKQIAADTEQLDDTHEEWKRNAERTERQLALRSRPEENRFRLTNSFRKGPTRRGRYDRSASESKWCLCVARVVPHDILPSALAPYGNPTQECRRYARIDLFQRALCQAGSFSCVGRTPSQCASG